MDSHRRRDHCFVSNGHLEVDSTCWARIVVANADSSADGIVAYWEGVGMSPSPAGEESFFFLPAPT
jgi:hypothetical protein